MPTGSFAVTGTTLQFVSLKSGTAFPFDQKWAKTEELTTNGVDSPRWRTLRSPRRTWSVEAYSEAASYSAAALLARQVQVISSQIGTLSVTVAGSVYTWTRVHAELDDANPYRIVNAPIIGPTLTTGSNSAYLVTNWTFTLTELSKTP